MGVCCDEGQRRGCSRGKATVTINDRSCELPIQMVDSNGEGYTWLAGDGRGVMIDELMVFHRALSDEEIRALYEAGSKGQSRKREPDAPGIWAR